MDKVYSLLRNNEKSGPYSLEEMVQKELKMVDLVWVEGKSSNWSTPSSWERWITGGPRSARRALSDTDGRAGSAGL